MVLHVSCATMRHERDRLQIKTRVDSGFVMWANDPNQKPLSGTSQPSN